MWWIYICCILIIIIIAIIAQCIQQKYIENFKQDDESVIKSLNICGRNLIFPYFKINGTLASSRANKANNSYLNTGTCINTSRDPNINPSFAIVHEDSLFYQLTSACLNVNMVDYVYGSDPVKFSIIFSNHNNNLVNFLTLNPLYVEFNPTDMNSTIGYSIIGPIVYNTELSNYSITFTPVFNAQITQDDLFNYPQNMPSKTHILNSDLQEMKNTGYANITIYYLDNLDTSFQSVGRTLNLTYNNDGINNIYDEKFANLYGISTSIQKYEFMNMLSLMYANQVSPVLSFQFNLQVFEPFPAANNNNIVIKTTADNYVGAYSTCTNTIDIPGTKQLNNIFSASIIDNKNSTFTLSVFTAKNQDCGLNNSSIVTCILPYSKNNMTVVLTLSPTNKILFVCWKDIYNNRKNISYTNIKLCSETDGLYDLFINPIAKDTLNNINMNYLTKYITNVKHCTLGYVNYNNVLNSI